MLRWNITKRPLAHFGMEKVKMTKAQIKHLENFWTDIVYASKCRKKVSKGRKIMSYDHWIDKLERE